MCLFVGDDAHSFAGKCNKPVDDRGSEVCLTVDLFWIEVLKF